MVTLSTGELTSNHSAHWTKLLTLITTLLLHPTYVHQYIVGIDEQSFTTIDIREWWIDVPNNSTMIFVYIEKYVLTCCLCSV